MPEKPTQSRRQIVLNVGVFVVAGILLTTGAVVGGALLDRSARFPIDIRHGLDLPVLATVSRLPEAKKVKKRRAFFKRSKKTESSRQIGTVDLVS